jgi:hypothetical protein
MRIVAIAITMESKGMEASCTICIPHAEARSEEADADHPDMMYKTSLLDAATVIQMFQTGVYLELRVGLSGLQGLWNGPAQFCWCGSGDSR